MIDPSIVVSCRNQPDWKIRLKAGIDYELIDLLKEKMPNETGGILIGYANSNTKTVYITRILKAPVDSESHPFMFKRGIKDIPQNILDIQEATGSMIGYIGEWHTHPQGYPSMSTRDLATAKGLKRHLDKVPMPTLIIIVTEKGLYPYIYPMK